MWVWTRVKEVCGGQRQNFCLIHRWSMTICWTRQWTLARGDGKFCSMRTFQETGGERRLAAVCACRIRTYPVTVLTPTPPPPPSDMGFWPPTPSRLRKYVEYPVAAMKLE